MHTVCIRLLQYTVHCEAVIMCGFVEMWLLCWFCRVLWNLECVQAANEYSDDTTKRIISWWLLRGFWYLAFSLAVSRLYSLSIICILIGILIRIFIISTFFRTLDVHLLHLHTHTHKKSKHVFLNQFQIIVWFALRHFAFKLQQFALNNWNLEVVCAWLVSGVSQQKR